MSKKGDGHIHLKHEVTINVTKPDGEKSHVLKSSRQTIRSRSFDLLFGKNVDLLVVTPDDSFETVEIKESRKGVWNTMKVDISINVNLEKLLESLLMVLLLFTKSYLGIIGGGMRTEPRTILILALKYVRMG